jgi:hypothetical protein
MMQRMFGEAVMLFLLRRCQVPIGRIAMRSVLAALMLCGFPVFGLHAEPSAPQPIEIVGRPFWVASGLPADDVVAIVTYDNASCRVEPSATVKEPASPRFGTLQRKSVDLAVPDGNACAGSTLPFQAFAYTWTNDNGDMGNCFTSDTFRLQYSPPDGRGTVIDIFETASFAPRIMFQTSTIPPTPPQDVTCNGNDKNEINRLLEQAALAANDVKDASAATASNPPSAEELKQIRSDIEEGWMKKTRRVPASAKRKLEVADEALRLQKTHEAALDLFEALWEIEEGASPRSAK